VTRQNPEPDPDFMDRLREKANAANQANGAGPRKLVRTKASDIPPRRMKWLWDKQIPLGSLTLLGGAAGMGKSTIAYDLASAITVGTLPGEYHGRPRSVAAVATEDAWEYTIVPRLVAAGADLHRIERITIETKGDIVGGTVQLGPDLPLLQQMCAEPSMAMMLLDPLMSRLSAELDAHKDQQVRQELEPLTAMLDSTQTTAFGLIHLNKGSGGTMLNRVMGSAAFGAVARAVLAVIDDPLPDDDGQEYRLIGSVKNNVGQISHAIRYHMANAVVDTEDGPTNVGHIRWGQTIPLTLQQAAAGAIDPDQAPSQAEAAVWLHDVMTTAGPAGIARQELVAQARRAGIDWKAIERVRGRLGIISRRSGFPSTATWIPPE
jgi:AAA domain